jgi:hypothetical protein
MQPGNIPKLLPHEQRELMQWQLRRLPQVMTMQLFVTMGAVGAAWWLRFLRYSVMQATVLSLLGISCFVVYRINSTGQWPGHEKLHGLVLPTRARAIVLTSWQALAVTIAYMFYANFAPLESLP